MFQLKATHKEIRDYFAELNRLGQLGYEHEGAVAPAFANILRAGARPFGWTLTEQYPRKATDGRSIRINSEFDRSLADTGVHVLDPFVGTGNFILRVITCRDAWAYNFNRNVLIENMRRMTRHYNAEVDRWKRRENQDVNVNDFVISDNRKMNWSGDLKQALTKGKVGYFAEDKVRPSLYRPFAKSNLYFDRLMNNSIYIFPTAETEKENRAICVSGIGSNKPFHCLMTQQIPDLHLTGNSQCFPFYTYNEDGSNRRENITDWALAQFRTQYKDDSITKWDIFHYVYGLLNHPQYREQYQANLKRDLPHIPFAPDFWAFAKAGARLANIHVDYDNHITPATLGRDDMTPYRLNKKETLGQSLNWRVEKMQLSEDKKSIRYNDFLTLEGIPEKAFAYRLGNRSALEWVLDQYRVKVDKRSGIVNAPNRADDPQYIVNLIQKVIAVSVETVEIVEGLPELSVVS